MTASLSAVEKLSKVHPDDRHWILERLSPEQRRRLASQLGNESMAASSDSPDDGDKEESIRGEKDKGVRATQVLAGAEPGVLANLLKTEPAWMVYALLQARKWTWEQAVVGSLASDVRREITRLGQVRMTFTDQLTSAVVQIAADKLQAGRADPAPSLRFDTVLARVRRSVLRKVTLGSRLQ